MGNLQKKLTKIDKISTQEDFIYLNLNLKISSLNGERNSNCSNGQCTSQGHYNSFCTNDGCDAGPWGDIFMNGSCQNFKCS